jgi:hypothetical protein
MVALADIQIPEMPVLASCPEGELGPMFLAVKAALPVHGRVQYQCRVRCSPSRVTMRPSCFALSKWVRHE